MIIKWGFYREAHDRQMDGIKQDKNCPKSIRLARTIYILKYISDSLLALSVFRMHYRCILSNGFESDNNAPL